MPLSVPPSKVPGELVAPGAVPVPCRRPDGEFEAGARSAMWGGVARR
ncbi:MAG: hypothetical protein ACRDNS_23080 [Trebonia sp.]